MSIQLHSLMELVQTPTVQPESTNLGLAIASLSKARNALNKRYVASVLT